MSRRKSAVKRTILPDARYDSQTVSKFINSLMIQGKKSTAEGIFYSAMDIVEAKTSQPGVSIFKQALNNLKPVVEVKSRRVGGATYQVPVEVRQDRRNALAMRWLINYSRDRNEKSMHEKLAAEVLAASKGEGNAIKKKEDTHRMAEANKAFAPYRWKYRPEGPGWTQCPGDCLRGIVRSQWYPGESRAPMHIRPRVGAVAVVRTVVLALTSTWYQIYESSRTQFSAGAHRPLVAQPRCRVPGRRRSNGSRRTNWRTGPHWCDRRTGARRPGRPNGADGRHWVEQWAHHLCG